jgi:group I intron endonuclease
MITTGEKLHGVSGIYCAIHRESGACYVGSSVNIGRRITQHIWGAKTGKHTAAFHVALNRHGLQAFDLEVLERCDRSQLLAREDFYIAFLNAASLSGLNTRRDSTGTNTNAWRSVSLVTRQRIGAKHKGKTISAEAREKIRIAATNPSPETRAKMRAAKLGKKWPLERRQKVSRTRTGMTRPPVTDETRAKMRRSRAEWIMKNPSKR